MSQFQSLWKMAAKKLQDGGEPESGGDDATVKMAEAFSQAVTGQGLDESQKKPAGAVVHYVYGTAIGAVYGVLAGVEPVVQSGAGMAYGAAAWLAGDKIAVPALGFTPPPSETPVTSHVSALAAHLVYGAVTHGIFRLLSRE